eukprot:g19582.t1
MSSVGSPAGKVRLNVVALIGDATIGKFLVSIDGDALVEDLASQLPGDERVGDALRDYEEVLAVLVQEPEDPAARLQLSHGLGDDLSFTRTTKQIPAFAKADAPTQRAVDRLEDLRRTDCLAPVSVMSSFGFKESPPGPQEIFQEDLQPRQAREAPRKDSVLELVPFLPLSEDVQGYTCKFKREESLSRPCGDWEVEQLTPKLREYITTRFREMHEMPADPGHSYITVSLRPLERPGSVVSPLPIFFSIARVDIIEFERLCGRKVQEIRARLDFFRRCLEALYSLLERGAGREDRKHPCASLFASLFASLCLWMTSRQFDGLFRTMHPTCFRTATSLRRRAKNATLLHMHGRGSKESSSEEAEFGSLLNEVDESSFGQVEGFRPLLVIDMAGGVGQNSVFIKAAVKRLMYSFLVAKSRFNIISFYRGKAEQFVDKLRPAKRTDILQALCWALDSDAATALGIRSCDLQLWPCGSEDSIYLLTSGLPKFADTEKT